MEDQLRQRLSQHPTPVDFEALWDEVEPRLPKKKRRVLPFWFWLIVGLALGSSLLFLHPGEIDTPPLVEATETTPPPLRTETPVLTEAKSSQPKQKSSLIATEGTFPKPPPAIKTSHTSQPPKTAPVALEPSPSVVERKAPMVYAATEIPGPEVNTPYSILTDETFPKSGVISLPLTSSIPNQQTTTIKPYVVIDPALMEEDKGPTTIKNVTETPKTDSPDAEYKTEDNSHVTKKTATRQELGGPKIAETETREAERDRRVAEKIASRQKREAEKIAEAEARQVEQERRQREKAAANQAEELARQERATKKEIARLATAERKARNLTEKRATKVANTSQKNNEKLAKSKALKVAKEQRALAKTELQKMQTRVREQREADKKRRAIEKMEAQRTEVLAAQQQEQERGSQQLALVNARRQAKEDRYRTKQAERAQREEARQREKRAQDSTPGKLAKESARMLTEARKQDAKRQQNLIKEGARKRRLLRLNERLARAETRRQAKEIRLAARTANKAERALARDEQQEKKPKNIRDKRPAYWTIEPGIAISLPSSSGNNGDGPGSEKALEGISLQALAGYHRASGLSFRTGIIRSRINSKVESEITRAGSQPQETVIAIIENQNGSRSEQLGIVQVATTETVTTKYYNSVSSTDIPLLIGYRFSRNKWGLMVEAGPSFNLYSGGKAHHYNGSGFADVGGDYFRNKLVGQGFLVNFGGAYGLSEKTALTVNLRFQSFGSGGFENPNVATVSTNYSLFGIQLGYRIRF